MRMPRNLLQLVRTTAFKLLAAYLVVFALFSVAMIAYVAWHTRALIESQVAENVEGEVRFLAEQYRIGGIQRLVIVIDRRTRRPGSSIYLLTNFTGEVMASNVSDLPIGLLDKPGTRITPYRRSDEPGAKEFLAFVQVFQLPGGYRLLVGRDIEERDTLRQLVVRPAQGALVLILVLGIAGGIFVTRRVLKRIESMTATSETIMAGDLSGRLAVDGTGDEFDRLAQSLNTMLDRIEALMVGLKEVSDNIAHDLKTPLTRLRNRAEEALRGAHSDEEWRAALETTIEESDSLMRTFDALLMIARAEAGQARDNMVDLLVDNALKYGRVAEGERGEIRVSLRRVGDEAVLEVGDRGPGIAPQDRERVVERFVRLDASRSRPGSGLGLSLVAAVARLHGGSLAFSDNGPGLRATLRLPAKTP
ncbi:MAG: two-component sensor histidine kinase [Rhizobiales bacterium 24-66-13]|nr:MAG: two-component sensor histidine kinase [Rhizobiales bacterium 24-66-13]